MDHEFKKNENCYRKLIMLSLGPVNLGASKKLTEIPQENSTNIK